MILSLISKTEIIVDQIETFFFILSLITNIFFIK